MPVKHGLLGVLALRPLHGYELKGAFEEKAGGFWELNFGQVYTTLERLAKEGLVRAAGEEDGKGERRVYEITPEGALEFQEWLKKPVSRTRPLRDELLIKLAFMDPDEPGPFLKTLNSQKQLCLERMQSITRRRFELAKQEAIPDRVVAGLILDAALFHAEADLRWLEHCEGILLARQKGKGLKPPHDHP